MKTRVAGPTLRALVAGTVGRLLLQRSGRFSRGLGHPARSGVFREDGNGVVLITTNDVKVVEKAVLSRLTWECTHRDWSLRFTERRQLDDNGSFEKIAPYEVSLQGDLLEAARFLGLPRELFFGAVRADAWTKAEIAIERLRWLDVPYAQQGKGLNVILRLL